MSGGHKRRAYLATCIGLAKSDPHWVKSIIADWDQQSEAARKGNSMRPIHIALCKLALHRVGALGRRPCITLNFQDERVDGKAQVDDE